MARHSKNEETKHTTINFSNSMKSLGVYFGEGISSKLNSVKTEFVNDFKSMFSNTFKKVTGTFTNMFTNALDEFKTIIDSSRLSSSSTRETALKYGFYASETYAWTKALEGMGFTSEEDLFWSTNEELTMFRNLFQNYANKYNDLYDQGLFKDMRAYEIEMTQMKEEFSLQVVKFLVDNKGLIINFMNVSMWALKGLLSIVQSISDFFNIKVNEPWTAYSSDLLTNKNQEIKVTISNSYSNVSKSDQSFIEESNAITLNDLISVTKQLGGYSL